MFLRESAIGGAHGPWESSGLPCSVTPSRYTRPLGVVQLAMRRHSLTELVQSAQYSRLGTVVIA